jgi:peptide/nickel transport system permease protein
MRWRLVFLLALLLPELPLDPFRGDLGASWLHLLGTDALGRDGLLRLVLAGARSLGFASAVALLALCLAAVAALGAERFKGARSALRAIPPLLFLLPLAAAWGGLSWMALALLLGSLLALQLEPPLRARLEPFRRGPAWAMNRVLGGSWLHRTRIWTPWVADQTASLFPTAWLGALWGEATLRLLGLGPGPQHDSLGLLLNQELPRLSTDGTPLGWASLMLVLALAALSAFRRGGSVGN